MAWRWMTCSLEGAEVAGDVDGYLRGPASSSLLAWSRWCLWEAYETITSLSSSLKGSATLLYTTGALSRSVAARPSRIDSGRAASGAAELQLVGMGGRLKGSGKAWGILRSQIFAHLLDNIFVCNWRNSSGVQVFFNDSETAGAMAICWRMAPKTPRELTGWQLRGREVRASGGVRWREVFREGSHPITVTC
ncbi:hypothetical protein HPB51_000976 [Rhipicephalus microplus]|uniref:Uncharacterized protein n=1 Tax=Rhipicephalus microplus TaxID=6941 RepID=A0A9J6DE02_RHIMP|nr:hypothetical protein HPB51_000976 [Rhipicephalus microplus]